MIRARKLILLISLPVIVSPAVSDPWGTNTVDTGAHPDPDPHGYCFSYTMNDWLIHYVTEIEENALANPTEAQAPRDTPCTGSGSAETDVMWWVEDLPPRVTGSSHCDDLNSGICDQAYASIDVQEIYIGGEDEIDFKQTICHELGHTAGLTHGGNSNDCMINSGDTPPTELRYRRYGDHHTTHINDWF